MQGVLQQGLQSLEQRAEHEEDVPDKGQVAELIKTADKLLQLKEAGNKYEFMVMYHLLGLHTLLDKAYVRTYSRGNDVQSVSRRRRIFTSFCQIQALQGLTCCKGHFPYLL